MVVVFFVIASIYLEAPVCDSNYQTKFVIVQDRFCPALIVPVAETPSFNTLQSGPLGDTNPVRGFSVIVKVPGPNITI
jgi:hypothetical protein